MNNSELILLLLGSNLISIIGMILFRNNIISLLAHIFAIIICMINVVVANFDPEYYILFPSGLFVLYILFTYFALMIIYYFIRGVYRHLYG